MNREQYLNTAVSLIHSDFFPTHDAPPVRISLAAMPASRLGECHPRANSKDGHNEIFISASSDDTIQLLATLIHEYIHALDDNKHKHGPVFQMMAKSAGLMSPFTQLHYGEELTQKLNEYLELLGPIPHAELIINPKSKGRNNNKLVCNTCDFKANLSAKWAAQINDGFECPVCQDTTTQVEISG